MSVYSPVVAGIPALPVNDWRSVAKLIEHTLLKPDATRSQVINVCSEAVHYGFHLVMVNPANVALAAAQVHGTPVQVGTVIGFPLGAWTAERFGRVPTVVGFGIFITAGHLWYYWGPPTHFAWPLMWLGTGFCWFDICDNGGTVASNAAATELFPTPLRGTMIGWFALVSAIGAVISNAAVALLAHAMG